MTLTEKILNYCEEHNMKITEFEDMCHISRGLIKVWKSYRCSPTLKMIQRLEAGTGIPLEEWIKDTGGNV